MAVGAGSVGTDPTAEVDRIAKWSAPTSEVERLRQLLGEIDIYVNGGDLDNENALLQPQAYIGMFAEAACPRFYPA